ncbi:hypothetical protein GCM10027605_57510 [Micromonospora zhanjiangensis]
MAVAPVPPVAYDATAVRPDWGDLPEPLRTAIDQRLGAPVRAAGSAGGGFTRGFASLLETSTGDRVFVKTASLRTQPHLCDWYAREAAVLAALPSGLPATRARWTMTAAGHFVSCLDAVPGRMPALPWRPAELDATLTAYAKICAALAEPPPNWSVWACPGSRTWPGTIFPAGARSPPAANRCPRSRPGSRPDWPTWSGWSHCCPGTPSPPV